MFGFSKSEQIASLKKQLEKAKSNAKHFYNMKGDVEDRAFYNLAELARNNGTSARVAAKTKEGILIISEVVLNRQWAFYLNEEAIQIQAKINALMGPTYSNDVAGKSFWFDKVVTPAGLDIVMDQLEPMCGKLIDDVDEYIK